MSFERENDGEIKLSEAKIKYEILGQMEEPEQIEGENGGFQRFWRQNEIEESSDFRVQNRRATGDEWKLWEAEILG